MLENHFNQKSSKSLISRNENITATKAAEDSTTGWLKEETPSWKDIDDVVNACLEKKKINSAKSEAEPHGYSLEALANLRSKLLSENQLYFLQLNDRNINGNSTFIFKMSEVHAKLAKNG